MITILFTGLLYFIGFLSVIALVLYFAIYKHKIDVTRNIPSPPSLPIVGHAFHAVWKQPHELVYLARSWFETYGKTFKLWLGPELNVMMADVKDVEEMLSTTRFNDKAHEYDTLRPWLREGLLVSSGKKWHQRRKVLTPAFHFKILEQFIDIFERETRSLLRNLDKEYRMQTEEGFELFKWLNLITLDTICEAAMGVPVHAQINADSEYVRAVKSIANVLHQRMYNIFYRFDFTYRFTPLAREEKKALDILHGFSERVIIQRRGELLKEQAQGIKQSATDDVGSKRKMAFLDILLQAEIDGKPLSNLDIREEVDTFMFEGHDTTTSALTFCFYALATYPWCQQKCVDEIIEVMGKDNSKPVNSEVLTKLHYVELCIKESLRMFPPVPLLGRKVHEECEINGKIIPAGTNIGTCPLHLGRQEEFFPDPHVFTPERFEVGFSKENFSPYAYIPFSAGPRNCIGQKFAMLELKTVVVNVLRHYELEYVGDRMYWFPVIAELVLKSKDPIMFKIKPRVYK